MPSVVRGRRPSSGTAARDAATSAEDAERTATAGYLRKVLAARQAAQDLLDVGAYQHGTNPLVDAAVTHAAAIDAFLQQRMDDQTPAGQAWDRLTALTTLLRGA